MKNRHIQSPGKLTAPNIVLEEQMAKSLDTDSEMR